MPSTANRQRGASLIIVLIVLTVVMGLGLVAMRSGMMNSAASTNAQVNTLLFQAADAGITMVEDEINSNVAAAMQTTGLIGMVINTPGSERVGCMLKASLQKPTLAANNPCTQTDFISARGASQVHFAMVNPSVPGGIGGKTTPTLGSDDDATPTAAQPVIRVYSSSIMPNFGSTTWSQISGCLTKNNDEETDSANDQIVSVCLNEAHAAASTLVQEFNFGYGGYATP